MQVVEIQWANGTSSELPLQDLGLLAVDDVWKGAQVTRVDLSNLGLQDSLVVLEPEYVVDATEVATAMAGLKPAPISALLHRLTAVSSTQAMVAGTLLNTAFDLLAADPDRTDEDVLQAAFSGRSLALSALAFDGISVEDLYQATAERLPALRSTLRGWSASEVVVEPYVISPVVGLQGRFDILVTGASSIELVEMKGGSPPRTGVRPSHLVQAACYALLHIAVMNRLPDSLWLWYVTDDTTPFREIDRRVLAQTVADVIHTRNAIVAQDRAIAGRRFDHLRLISGDMAGISSYDRNDADRFSEAYRGVDAVTRTVFQAWMAFVHAERWEQRMGELGTRARASLWRQTRDEKADDPSCIGDLIVDPVASDLETMKLVLRTETISDCALRPGDLVLLHAVMDKSDAGIQILKGTLEQIDATSVVVTLRNKQASPDHLLSATWMVETDVADASLTNLVPSLRSFLEAPPDRRAVLLGRRAPTFASGQPPSDPDLTPEQQAIVGKALSAQDYVLIQGPPGTGKTSRILRSIVKALLADPAERVLVLAYTNRAVNEICRVLDTALRPGAYLRHGSAAGVHGTDLNAAIPALGRHLSPVELADRIANCRCIVATVSSLHSGRDIFSFGEFTTAIVDEASQILEPYLVGPLLHARRSILIGDHYQLPPVVALPEQELALSAPLLADIGFTNLGMTTFERLHRRCTAMGWDQAMATLTHQGRMHRDVMAFPSNAFYGGVLQTVAPWQENDHPLPWHHILPSRAVFVPVEGSPQADAEVRVIVDLVSRVAETARSDGREISIGIITPFRVQNRAIALALPNELRSWVTVDTVERFQGSQRDVIFFGATVGSSVELRNIRSDVELEGRVIDRKFNVACTRAREQFVLVGHPTVLKGAPVYANALSVLTWLYGR